MPVPEISIIVPTYNAGQVIDRCLASLASQTFRNFEVVIVDGLSGDATLEKAKSASAALPDCTLVSEKDQGVYDAMNKGVRLSKGRWLLFLGADDILADSEVLSEIFKLLAVTTADLIYGNVKLSGHFLWAQDSQIYDGAFTRDKLFQKNICHQAIFYRRSLFEQVGHYDTTYKICADWDFNLRCFSRRSAAYADQIISVFAGGGLSTSTSLDQFASRDIIYKIREYFGLSFFHKSMSGFRHVYESELARSRASKRLWPALLFLVLLVYHSNRKWKTFKKFARPTAA